MSAGRGRGALYCAVYTRRSTSAGAPPGDPEPRLADATATAVLSRQDPARPWGAGHHGIAMVRRDLQRQSQFSQLLRPFRRGAPRLLYYLPGIHDARGPKAGLGTGTAGMYCGERADDTFWLATRGPYSAPGQYLPGGSGTGD